MKRLFSLLTFTFVLFASTQDAHAVCRSYPGSTFFPPANDTHTIKLETDGKPCGIGFRLNQTMFTSATILAKPKNGVISETSSYRFRYVPKNNYKGMDTFTIKVCGDSLRGKGSGCSTLNYQIKVI